MSFRVSGDRSHLLCLRDRCNLQCLGDRNGSLIYIQYMDGDFQDGNIHFQCHFLSVFMLTWNQNEPSEGREKHSVHKYTKKSLVIALFLWEVGSIQHN